MVCPSRTSACELTTTLLTTTLVLAWTGFENWATAGFGFSTITCGYTWSTRDRRDLTMPARGEAPAALVQLPDRAASASRSPIQAKPI